MLAYKINSGSAEARAAAIYEFKAVAAEKRRIALRGAHAVLELERTGAHYHEGASSIGHFGEMNGIAAHEAREWHNLGVAITSRDSRGGSLQEGALAPLDPSLGPCLEEQVAVGSIPVASAAVLGELVAAQLGLPEASEPMVRPDDQWIVWARTKSTRDFRRMFVRRRDEVRAGEEVTPVTAYVTNTVRENLDRARVLTSRNAHQVLTLGQMLGIIVHEWLAVHDPLETTPGTRRLPDTATIPGSRYVPAEVDRKVRARSNDGCIVPLCHQSMWVHKSHRVAHCDGGSREAWQLDLLCDFHHLLYEDGKLLITGPADAPSVTDAYGRAIDLRQPWNFGNDDPPNPAGAAPAGSIPDSS